MIITKTALVYITTKNIGHFKKLGFEAEPWTSLSVPVECLSKGSSTSIVCACDECKKERVMRYAIYLKYINKNNGKYYCRNCAQKILEENNLLKTGFKFPAQNPIVKDKMKNSLESNFNISNPVFLRKYRKVNKKENPL